LLEGKAPKDTEDGPSVIIGKGRIGQTLKDLGKGDDVLVGRGEKIPLSLDGLESFPIYVSYFRAHSDCIKFYGDPCSFSGLIERSSIVTTINANLGFSQTEILHSKPAWICRSACPTTKLKAS
jgi:hypothetical protein